MKERKFKPIDERKAGLDVLNALEKYKEVVNSLDRQKIVMGSYDYFLINLNTQSINRATQNRWGHNL